MYLTTSDVSVFEAAARREQFARDASTRRFARLAGDGSGQRESLRSRTASKRTHRWLK